MHTHTATEEKKNVNKSTKERTIFDRPLETAQNNEHHIPTIRTTSSSRGHFRHSKDRSG